MGIVTHFPEPTYKHESPMISLTMEEVTRWTPRDSAELMLQFNVELVQLKAQDDTGFMNSMILKCEPSPYVLGGHPPRS